jgi:hypothetical protein
MTLFDLIAKTYQLLGTSAVNNDRLTPAVIASFIDDDYIAFAKETMCFSRSMMQATAAPVKASGTVGYLTATPSDGDTVTIGSQVYQFKTTPGAINDVQIGADMFVSLSNLYSAVNGANFGGSTNADLSVNPPCDPVPFFPGIIANQFVTASFITAGVMVLTAKLRGTMGNTIPLSFLTPGGPRFSITAMANGTDATYAFPLDFIQIKSIRYGEQRLTSITEEMLDVKYGFGWREECAGSPRHYYLPMTGKIGCFPPTDGKQPLIFDGYCVPDNTVNVYPQFVASGMVGSGGSYTSIPIMNISPVVVGTHQYQYCTLVLTSASTGAVMTMQISDNSSAAFTVPTLTPYTPAAGDFFTVLTNTSQPAFPSQFHEALAYGAVMRICGLPLFDIDGAQTLLTMSNAIRQALVIRYKESQALVESGMDMGEAYLNYDY